MNKFFLATAAVAIAFAAPAHAIDIGGIGGIGGIHGAKAKAVTSGSNRGTGQVQKRISESMATTLAESELIIDGTLNTAGQDKLKVDYTGNSYGLAANYEYIKTNGGSASAKSRSAVSGGLGVIVDGGLTIDD